MKGGPKDPVRTHGRRIMIVAAVTRKLKARGMTTITLHLRPTSGWGWRKVPLNTRQVARIVNALLAELTELLGAGVDVHLEHFGRFHVARRRCVHRCLLSPQPTQELASVRVFFRPAKLVKQHLNYRRRKR